MRWGGVYKARRIRQSSVSLLSLLQVQSAPLNTESILLILYRCSSSSTCSSLRYPPSSASSRRRPSVRHTLRQNRREHKTSFHLASIYFIVHSVRVSLSYTFLVLPSSYPFGVLSRLTMFPLQTMYSLILPTAYPHTYTFASSLFFGMSSRARGGARVELF